MGQFSAKTNRHAKRAKPDGFPVRALAPALKGKVCRVTDQTAKMNRQSVFAYTKDVLKRLPT